MLVRNDMRATNQLGIGVAIVLTALGVVGCGGGGGGGGGSGANPPGSPGSPSQPNRAPVASNDVLRADGTALTAIGVLTNDSDPDGNPLTVTIEEQSPVGTATVNTDGTVRLASLPTDFKGVTRFRYRVSDGAGMSSVATAVVFVGTDPFRVFFAGDASANGSNEVYVADFISPPTAVTVATEGNKRLRGFVASKNGATVVYRRADTGPPVTTDLSFAKTTAPAQQVRITLPAGTTLVQDFSGNDQYIVSADGQWIAFIVSDTSNVRSAYTVNINSPTAVNRVSVVGASFASKLRFSSNSKSLYLLASPATNGANKSLYTAELGTANVGLISAPAAAASADDVIDYSVAADQSRFLIRANRSGREGLYFIDASQLQNETRVSHALGLLEALAADSTVGLPPEIGGSARAQRVAYTTNTLNVANIPVGFTTYGADVSAAPSPHTVTTAVIVTKVLGLRPPADDAVLFRKGPEQGAEIREVAFTGASETLVGAGIEAWYDSTGNIVLLKQNLSSGSTSYRGLAVAVRGSFGSTLPLGSPAQAALYSDVSGFEHAVVVLGEGPTSGAAPSTARLALVNALAPDKLLYLADFQSPLGLASNASQVTAR